MIVSFVYFVCLGIDSFVDIISWIVDRVLFIYNHLIPVQALEIAEYHTFSFAVILPFSKFRKLNEKKCVNDGAKKDAKVKNLILDYQFFILRVICTTITSCSSETEQEQASEKCVDIDEDLEPL